MLHTKVASKNSSQSQRFRFSKVIHNLNEMSFEERLQKLADTKPQTEDDLLIEEVLKVQAIPEAPKKEFELRLVSVHKQWQDKQPLTLAQKMFCRSIVERSAQKKKLINDALERVEKGLCVSPREQEFITSILRFYNKAGFISQKQTNALKSILASE